MDPDAARRELDEAVRDGDTERAAELRAALAEWQRKGGFPPR